MKIYEHVFTETQQHPECKDGYVFGRNFTHAGYDNIGWKDKYFGYKSYDIYGNELKGYGYTPAFFSIKELVSNGFSVVRK